MHHHCRVRTSGNRSYDCGPSVDRIIAGQNVTISPTTGLGEVTVNSSGGGGGGGGADEYRDISAMASSTDYVVAVLPSASAEGSATFTIRALEPTIKHTLTFRATLHESNAVQFTVLQNVFESDTPRFLQLKLNTDGTESQIIVRCGTAVVKAEMSVYHNEDSSGSLTTYGSPFTIPASLTVASGVTQQEHSLIQKAFSTSASVHADAKLTSPLTETSVLAAMEVNALAPAVNVTYNSDIAMTGNSIRTANTVDTTVLTNTTGPVAMGASLNMAGQTLTDASQPAINLGANLDFQGLQGLTQCAFMNNPAAGCQVSGGGLLMNSNPVSDVSALSATNATIAQLSGVGTPPVVNLQGTSNFTGLAAPLAASDATNKAYVDTAVSNGVGGVTFPVNNPMTSNLDSGGFEVNNASNVNSTQVSTDTLTTSNPATTSIACSSKRLSDVTDPTQPQDAATKAYVDSNSGFTNPATSNLDMSGNNVLLANGFVQDGYFIGLPWSYTTTAVCTVTSGTAAQGVFFGTVTGTGPAAYAPLIQGAASIMIPIEGVYSIVMHGLWNGSIQGNDGGEQACFFLTDQGGARLMAFPSAQHYQSGTEWMHSFQFCGNLRAGDYRLYGNHYNGTKNFDGRITVTHII